MKTRRVNKIGILDEGWYRAEIDGKPSNLYRKWYSMLSRVSYDARIKPHYAGIEADPRFLHFQEFAEWADRQIGSSNPDWHLDKDILQPGNRVYGPDTCLFLPPQLNCLLTTAKAARGKYPVGVGMRRTENNFMIRCSIDGEQVRLFGFSSPETAFAAYKVIKELNVKRLAEKFRHQIDPRAYERLLAYEAKITD